MKKVHQMKSVLRMKTVLWILTSMLITCVLMSCDPQAGFPDAPVEGDDPGLSSEGQSPDGSESAMQYDNQDAASKAHQNMLAYFNWDFSREDIGKMPDDYGGCYINERNVFTVCVVGPDAESIAMYEEACKEPIEIKTVSYSMKKLYEASDMLRELITNGKLEVYGFGIDERNNCIPIMLPNEEAAEAAKQLLTDYPCVKISAADDSLTLSQYGDVPADDDVKIVPEYPVYDPSVTTVYFVMQNNGEKVLAFGGGDYEVEVKLGGKWYTIPMKPGIAFTTIGYGLHPDTHRYRVVNLGIFNYEFTAGKYRVVQKFDNHIYFGEFELGQSNITAKTPYGYKPIEDLPKSYTLEMAAADGCVISGREETYNRIEKFLDRIRWGMPSMVRIASENLWGNVTIIDIEYAWTPNGTRSNMAFFFTRDNTRESLSFNPGVEKHIYSFINYREEDNGIEILLSNYSNVRELTKDYDHQSILKIKDVESFMNISDLIKQVEERNSNSIPIYAIFSPGGTNSAALRDMPLQLGLQGPERGEIFDLPEDMADEITDIKWISEDRLQIIGTIDGKPDQEIAIFNTELWDFE